MYHATDAYDSDDADMPSRSYASPPPDHPANVEPPVHEYGARTVLVGGKAYTEHYDYASEHSSTHTSPAKTNGRWPADAFYDRNERGKAPSRAPSSRSSQYSAPSMYSAASATPGRLNSPLPPLPADPSPYEAAARAHAARLGLASGLNPNVLTVLPEMSIQDSNELYLPQRRNSRKFGSSSSELGARGNMSPKRSASLFSAKRYSRAASDIGHNPREYASSEFARPVYPGEFDRRHSFDPRRGSFDARSEAPRAPSRSQSFRAPSRTGDYNPGDVVAPSHGTGVISLDTPSVRPLNNYPLMESNGFDQTQGNGYTNMVLPKGGNFKPADPTRTSGPDLQLLGVPPTSMAAITLSSALHTYHLKHESPTPAHLRWTLPPPVDFSTVSPPHRVSSAQVLIQVYAVAVDWLDIAALDEKHKSDVGRWIPGRSFVGRCITTGVDEKEIARGDVVIGLLDIRHSGALAEYIVADRRRVARVNPETHLELEELAALPAQGIAVHRAIRDLRVARGQQALVMDAHEGLPALFCQELTRMGLVVTAIVPGGAEGAQAAALAYGARGVLAGTPASVMHTLPESLFALVVDTAGAADAARRVLADRGHVLSLRSGDGPAPKHTLKTKLGLAKKKSVSASFVQPAGAGDAPVDASGLDYRDVLEEPVLGVLHPAVAEVVPFEAGASVFASRRNADRLRVAVVRIVN
jgi:NADPH:quinone reductase-like Zn-dependent oxidoreductase